MKKILLLVLTLSLFGLMACAKKDNGAMEISTIDAKDCFDNAGFASFKVEEESDYIFKASGPSNLVWDIYVLDNEWDDAPRFIPQANEKKGSTEVTLHIQKGKYVYVYCPVNAFTADKAAEKDTLLVMRVQEVNKG